MKNKSAGFYASSLEMLLDTMCNMLGGVVFIALMVAVVAQDTITRTPDQNRNQAVHLTNDLAAITASNTVAEAEIQALLKRLQDPRERPKTNVMRLPNLENTTKRPWLVVLQYGKIYPLDVFSAETNGVPILNAEAMAYQPQSHYVEPIPERGEAPKSGVAQIIQSFKSNAKTNFYLAFWVYNDSFDAFIRARETATKLGFQYGWNPLPQNERLHVSQRGERVLPQN